MVDFTSIQFNTRKLSPMEWGMNRYRSVQKLNQKKIALRIRRAKSLAKAKEQAERAQKKVNSRKREYKKRKESMKIAEVVGTAKMKSKSKCIPCPLCRSGKIDSNSGQKTCKKCSEKQLADFRRFQKRSSTKRYY